MKAGSIPYFDISLRFHSSSPPSSSSCDTCSLRFLTTIPLEFELNLDNRNWQSCRPWQKIQFTVVLLAPSLHCVSVFRPNRHSSWMCTYSAYLPDRPLERTTIPA
ncbi:unnamed protein product [Protopolystoma xenopodis]|uniref:Uncharacterized protein n=1 Tax=Protopolystoma xenopodis TaxID=117903 RepID=A0A448XSY7_9PLAT|nr:unnamed protein product [Protopolystoma xenopodis]